VLPYRPRKQRQNGRNFRQAALPRTLGKSSEGPKAVTTWIVQDGSSPLASRNADATMRWQSPGGRGVVFTGTLADLDRESNCSIARASAVKTDRPTTGSRFGNTLRGQRETMERPECAWNRFARRQRSFRQITCDCALRLVCSLQYQPHLRNMLKLVLDIHFPRSPPVAAIF
jgi:hypothetical protein